MQEQAQTRVVSLRIYPIKSMGAVELQHASLSDAGFAYDREWMLVDEHGVFVSQRSLPELCLVRCQFNESSLTLSCDNKGSVSVSLRTLAEQSKICEVSVWDDRFQALQDSDEASQFFSDCFGKALRLVRRLPETSPGAQGGRLLEAKYLQAGEPMLPMHFGDSQPLHLLNYNSLRDLNARLDEAVDIDRFRGNILVDGLQAYSEDILLEFSIGGTKFRQSKTTSRCTMTTINQSSAERAHEPLRTLSAYRRINERVVFGSYVIHRQLGAVLQVGQVLEQMRFADDHLQPALARRW